MKKFFIWIGCFWVCACSSSLIYKPAPLQVIPVTESVQLTGTVAPWGLYFMAISRREQSHTRLVVLSELGIKLLDVAVFDDRTEVYAKQEKFPTSAVQAFVRFTRAALSTNCPPATIFYRDTRTKAVFEANVQKGGTVCY